MKSEKKIVSIILAAVLLISIFTFFPGCGKSSATSQLSNNVLVASADKSVSLSVPSGWNTNDTSLFPTAIIGVANTADGEYVVVTKRAKSEIGASSTVNDYMTVVKRVFATILANPVWGQTSSVTIGGCKGLAAQVSGTRKSDKSNVVFFVNALAGKNYYYNVCGYTVNNMTDANKANIGKIINSFKETN
jgi:hypothetical protein